MIEKEFEKQVKELQTIEENEPSEKSAPASSQSSQNVPKKGEEEETPEQKMKKKILVEDFLKEFDGKLEITNYPERIERTSIELEEFAKRLEELKSERADRLLKKREMEEQENQKQQWLNLKYFEALREDLDIGLPSMLFHINFLVRRIIVIGVAFLLNDYPIFQLFIFMLGGIFTMCYIASVKPFSNSRQDKMELFNEFVMLFIADIYASILGDDYDLKSLINFGYLLNFFIAALMFNIVLTIVMQASLIIARLKIYWVQLTQRCKAKAKADLAQAKPQADSPAKVEPKNLPDIEEESRTEKKPDL